MTTSMPDRHEAVRTASFGGELGGADFRPLTPAEQMTYPWRCVGRLEAKPPGGSYQHAGTATLVAPKMIVTASHCFRGRLFNEGYRFRFTPAYANGPQANDPNGGKRTRSGLTGRMVLGRPDHRGGSGVSDRVAGWDFAICELRDDLGAQWGHVGVYAAAKHTYDDVRWTSIGYPIGLLDGERPMLFPGIDIHDVDEDANDSREIETDDYQLRMWDSDFADGWSGGPLLAIRKGMWVVAGVLSGTEPDKLDIDGTNVFAGGPRLLAAHGEAHAQWSRFDWSGWFPVGGAFPAASSIAVVARRPGTFELFGRGIDDRIWQNDYSTADASGWTGWNPTAPGVLAAGPPTALSHHPDSVQLFVVSDDGQAQTTYWGNLDA